MGTEALQMPEPADFKVVSIVPTRIWIESDVFGSRHVMVQHNGFRPFTYATLYYEYGYTDNAGTHRAATELAKSIGAIEPVEERSREVNLAAIKDDPAEVRRKALEEADKLADALMGLLEDSQHAEHEDCEDGGYCPVRDGRRALARYQAIRALAGKE